MEIRTGQHSQSFTTEVTTKVTADYFLYLPTEYAASDDDWPLVLFLHGAGERGDDLNKVAVHGPPMRVRKGEGEFPFILVSPQCPERDWWTSPLQVATLNALLDDVVATYRVDRQRIYLTGLSMGGFGTFALAAVYPDRFAAIAPVCGGGEPGTAKQIAHIPAWVFHGARDDVVKPERSQEMVDALKAAGADVTFTLYPEANHNSWAETYNNPDLYTWLLRQRMK
ncbi:MAG: alpha/beta hydrolase [Kiritimatiellae bacterium]|nr:alpha/beta hydrolase [Kiritimatiellia bacterium]